MTQLRRRFQLGQGALGASAGFNIAGTAISAIQGHWTTAGLQSLIVVLLAFAAWWSYWQYTYWERILEELTARRDFARSMADKIGAADGVIVSAADGTSATKH
jgi:hypothetical protein